MAYTVSNRWSVAGTSGSLIVPEHWVPGLENDLPLFTFWNQFMAQTVGDVVVLGEGQGKIFKISYIQDTAVATTPLTAGTPIADTDSSGLGQTSGTLSEFGHSERIENLQAFLSNQDVSKSAAVSTARNALRTRNALIGAVFVGGANYFTIEGTTAAGVVETSGTTANGISPLLPTHVRAIKGILNRKGVAPYADGFYRWIGAPGMFDSIKANGIVYESAAQLGIPGLYATGEITKFNGFLFIEESGANAVTTYGTNGKSVIFGANPVAGYDDFMRADLITWYPDDQNDYGRTGKIGWKGLFGAVRIVDGSINARTWTVYSGK